MADSGRPTIFTPEIANKLCFEISSSSRSLKTICSLHDDLPSARTVLYWLTDNEEFLRQYTRAKEEQADYLAEEIMEISDDGTNDFMTITKGDETYNVENKEWTSRSKLRVEARKWIASKLKPKKYGDRVMNELSGPGGEAINLTMNLNNS